jgi:hypothetical protein
MKKLLSLLAVLAIAVFFGGARALMAQEYDDGNNSQQPEEMTVPQDEMTVAQEEMTVAKIVEQDRHLRSKIEPLLPSGADPVEAAGGFKKLEEFVASANIAKNLELSFDKLKAEVVGPAEGKLDKALRTLKPDLSEDAVREEVAKAERQTVEVIDAASREAQEEAQMAKTQAPEEEEEEEGDDSPETGQP